MTEPTTVRFHTEPAVEAEEEWAFWEAMACHKEAVKQFLRCGYTEEEALDTIDQIDRDHEQEECPTCEEDIATLPAYFPSPAGHD